MKVTEEDVELGKEEFKIANRIVGYEPAVRLETLLFAPYNCSIHPQLQQQALAASLKKFGWLVPLVVNIQTQHLLEGTARVMNAYALGVRYAPVVYVDIEAEEEVAALMVLHNIARMSLTDLDLQEEAVLEYMGKPKRARFIILLQKLGVIRFGPDSQKRSFSKKKPLEQQEVVQYQARRLGRELWQLGDGNLRLWGTREEIEQFIGNNPISKKRVA